MSLGTSLLLSLLDRARSATFAKMAKATVVILALIVAPVVALSIETERRPFIVSSSACLIAAVANGEESQPNYDGLLDLPPVTDGCARIYLARHGQTENNRLGLVQGARVDPSLNANGLAQARRLGLAISRLERSSQRPRVVVHSRLRRAKETAQVLAQTAAVEISSSPLSCLNEVDFGEFIEGKGVCQAWKREAPDVRGVVAKLINQPFQKKV